MLFNMEAPADGRKREFFFKKGNQYAKGIGKPSTSKKQMEIIRRRILMVVRRRIMHEKDLSTVSTTDLLKFVATIMPKDYALAVRPEVNYISNVPREEDALPAPEAPQMIVDTIEAETALPLEEEVPAPTPEPVESASQ